MTPFMRRVHQACVVVQALSAIGWAYAFAVRPGWLFLFNYLWCVAFGAYSFHVLRADKRSVKA